MRQVAALKSRTPGDLPRDGWNEYMQNHRSELSADLERAAQMMRAGDTIGLAKTVLDGRDDRAARAAAAASSGDPISQ